MAEEKSKSSAEEDDGLDTYDTYLEYNRVLRTWFVAFGIGGPAVFLVNPGVAQKLATAGQLRGVVILFLLGAGFQVVGALLNKIANWYVYQALLDPQVKGTRRHRAAEWLIDKFSFDIALDLGTVFVFGYAAWVVLTVFATP